MIPVVNFHELAIFLFATINMSKNIQIQRVLIDFRFIVYSWNDIYYVLWWLFFITSFYYDLFTIGFQFLNRFQWMFRVVCSALNFLNSVD